MNSKDYKAIAEMIINYGTSINTCFIKELADYFEREDIEKCNHLEKDRAEKALLLVGDNFDRKQFLKDCGMK